MRYRFVDRIVAFDPGPPQALTITKTFPAGDDCFTGPLPDAVPASLLIETLATAGGHLIRRVLGAGRLPLLLKVEAASDIGAVRPGEPVVAKVVLRGTGGSGEPTMVAQAEGEASVNGRPVLRCRLLYACVKVSDPKPMEEVGW